MTIENRMISMVVKVPLILRSRMAIRKSITAKLIGTSVAMSCCEASGKALFIMTIPVR